MFQIRVQAADMAEEEEAKAEEPAPPQQEMQGASFLAGNPQVRVTTGKLRFYRADKPYSSASSSASAQLPSERSTLVCVVTVPSHMSPVEILEFLASFRESIALVRILKDPERSNCMVLMQFNSQERADQFFLVRCRNICARGLVFRA
jgi:hypothetical protein